jgi:hypothetical protein
MKRAMTAALAALSISAVAVGATGAGASVATKADPQKVCDAIASQPESAKDELAAIRLAQSGKNPELKKALAAMEKAARKAVKTKKEAPINSDAYNANLEKLFAFAYGECSDVQVEALLGADGLSGFPTTVDAGALGVKLTNETDVGVGFGLVRVDDGNTATTDEIVASIFAAGDEEQPEGIQFVGGGGASAGSAGYAIGPVESGRYIFVVFNEDEQSDTAAGVAEFTVS